MCVPYVCMQSLFKTNTAYLVVLGVSMVVPLVGLACFGLLLGFHVYIWFRGKYRLGVHVYIWFRGENLLDLCWGTWSVDCIES